MLLKHVKWICAVDSRQGRLLRCGVAPVGRCHVEETDSTTWDWPGHERGRPTPLAGKNGHTYGSRGHDEEEQLDRFARQIVAWLGKKLAAADIERIEVFAPPRFLGALRKAGSGRWNGRVSEHEADVAHLGAPALAEHPIIRRLVGLDVAS